MNDFKRLITGVRMTDFKRLMLPAQASQGWYIAIDELSAGWLSTRGVIAVPNGTSLNIYFPTELEAYEAAKTYYSRHKMYYPHELALNALRYGIDAVEKIDTNESQVMEFI